MFVSTFIQQLCTNDGLLSSQLYDSLESNRNEENTGWLLKGVDALSQIGNGKPREYEHPSFSPQAQRQRIAKEELLEEN